jgi:RNA polymerase sigma-70 factor (ECF subfamily)
MALTFDDAVEITRIKPDAAGHEGYGMERRPYLMRDGSAATVKVSVHPDPMPPQRDVGAALAALSQEDLLRLRAIARLRARSLPPGAMSWSDLLQEAVLRALTGTRPCPPAVPLLAFLAGVMRSLCDEQWRRHRRQEHLPILHGGGGADDPERACAAAEALAAIQRLFASDEAALKVITGMISGMGAEEIRCHCDMTAVEYDTTRRRIRRTILRHGLAWSWP